MNEKNKPNRHGLYRYIDASIRREVRQQCQFGCAICGFAIGEYHHFAPEFKDATTHDPNGIIYLCRNHHGLAGSGLLPLREIKKAWESPYCKVSGHPHSKLFSDNEYPTIMIGKNAFKAVTFPILFLNHSPITVESPEDIGGPIRISAKFYNTRGELSLVINRNEITYVRDNWDIVCEGTSVIVRDAIGTVSLDIDFNVEDRVISIRRFKTLIKNHSLTINKNYVEYQAPGEPPWRMYTERGFCEYSFAGYCYKSDVTELEIAIMTGRKNVLGDWISANDN